MRCSPADMPDIVRILKDDTVFNNVSDDGSNNVDDVYSFALGLLDNVSVYVLQPRANTVLFYIPVNSYTYDIHIAVIKGGGRKHAIADAFKTIIWMLDNTKAKKFIANAPVCNKAALRFAINSGMVKEGCITSAYRKGGKMYDIHVYGATEAQIRDKQKES